MKQNLKFEGKHKPLYISKKKLVKSIYLFEKQVFKIMKLENRYFLKIRH